MTSKQGEESKCAEEGWGTLFDDRCKKREGEETKGVRKGVCVRKEIQMQEKKKRTQNEGGQYMGRVQQTTYPDEKKGRSEKPRNQTTQEPNRAKEKRAEEQT